MNDSVSKHCGLQIYLKQRMWIEVVWVFYLFEYLQGTAVFDVHRTYLEN